MVMAGQLYRILSPCLSSGLSSSSSCCPPTLLMADQRSGDSWSCRRRGRSLAYLLGIVQTNNSEAAEYSVSTPVREFTGGRHVSYVSEIKMNWKVTSFVLTWIFSQSIDYKTEVRYLQVKPQMTLLDRLVRLSDHFGQKMK